MLVSPLQLFVILSSAGFHAVAGNGSSDPPDVPTFLSESEMLKNLQDVGASAVLILTSEY